MPSVAVREMAHLPAGLLEDIVEMRAVERAKRAYESAQRLESGPEKHRIMADPLVSLVRELEFEAVRERLAGHGG